MTLQTTHEDGHTHVATLDWAGNGITDPGPKDGHVHNVKHWSVKPAGNGHTHGIPR